MEFFQPLIGGLLIGVAAGIYLLFNGKIMGASGIIGGLLSPRLNKDYVEKLVFIFGMMLAPWFFLIFSDLPKIEVSENISLLIVAGLLVGFGTRMGSGCTSGHGVCGMGRLSKRSIIAVLVFMASAIVTVFIQNHIMN